MSLIDCPNCANAVDERSLRTEHLTVEKCPHCGDIVRQSEGFAWRDTDAQIQEDVSGIAAWLDTVARQTEGMTVTVDPAKETSGLYVWVITGVSGSWLCQVRFLTKTLGIAEIRLLSRASLEVVFADKEKLPAIAAAHGVQPHGERITSTDQGVTGLWGVCLFLATHILPTGLFPAVVDRLSAAMQDAANQFRIADSS
jgi:hypothetical protein